MLRVALALAGLLLVPGFVSAQLRIVNYNVGQLNGNQVSIQAVLSDLMVDDKPGFAAAPHIFIFQEVQSADANPAGSSPLYTMLNNVAPPGITYARATFTIAADGPGACGSEDGAAGGQALFYRTDTIQEDASGHLDIYTGACRNTDRWKLRLAGYGSAAAVIYVYSSHLKAGDTTAEAAERLSGVNTIRADANGLGSDVHVIFGGDFNLYRSTELAYQAWIAAGVSQAIDPLGTANWEGAIAPLKDTQAPCLSGCGSLTGGGLDDRFDFQLSSTAFHDAEGLSLIPGTYRSFGNDGLHYNASINTGNNTYYPADIPRSNLIASRLFNASDHIPVVAEYQIPAVMSALLPPSFGRVIQGASLLLPLEVSNDVDVQVPQGGDELEFSASGFNGVIGTVSGTAIALGGPVLRELAVDTTVIGQVSAIVSVTTASQGAQNSAIPLNTTGQVIRTSNASFAADSDVNAMDVYRVLLIDSGDHAFSANVSNIGFDADQSLLDVDGVSGLGGPVSFQTGSVSGIGTESAVLEFEIATDGFTAGNSNYAATVIVSDENVPGEQTAGLSLNVHMSLRSRLGDVDDDCDVDLSDLSELIGGFGLCQVDAGFRWWTDLDNSGCTGLSDLSVILSEFGLGCP